MANRFLETNYYKSPFVRSLKGAIKGLYSFIICDCTPSGIWAKDIEAASLYIGFTVNDEDFFENFVKRGKAIDLGNGKFFFPDFIEHQYPSGLHDDNKAHKNIISELNKLGFLRKTVMKKDVKNSSEKKDVDVFFSKKEAPLKPLESPLKGTQGNGYGNGQGNDNGKGNGQGNEGEPEFSMNGQGQYIVPEMQNIWDKHNPHYAKDKNKDFTALREIGDFILSQEKIKADVRDKITKISEAFEIISKYVSTHDFFKTYSLKQVSTHIQSIVSNIRNGTKSKQPTGGNVSTESAFDAIDRYYDKIGKR